MSHIYEALQKARTTGTPVVKPATPAAATAGVPLFAEPAALVPGAIETPRIEFRPTPMPSPSIVNGRLVAGPRQTDATVEQYRRLAAALHHVQNARQIRRVMVASALASEGKTFTAGNLAVTLSESYGRSVLLIDADLRRPSQHQLFNVPNVTGLRDALAEWQSATLPVMQISANLSVMTAGRPSSNPMRELVGDRMRDLLQQAARTFDWVIIDTPPVGVTTDANLMARLADAAVLVIRAGRTPYKLVQRAVESLGRDRVLGVVLNGITHGFGGYSGYSYYYGTGKADDGRKKSR